MLVKNALIARPGLDVPVHGDILLEDGRIAAIGRRLDASGEVINADGLLVLPGAIDPHVHFFDPGYPHKETFAAASAGSAAGGVTTVIDMPDTSIPMAIDGASVREKRDHIAERTLIDFGLFGGISGALCDEHLERRITEMAPLVCAIKTYETSGADFFPRVNHYQYWKILELIRKHDAILLVHAEDWDYVSNATPDARESGDSGMAFYQSRPEIAETLSVFCVTEIAEQIGAEMHIVHLGVERAAEIVAGRRHVSGETCPQYLAFDCEDFERIGAPLKITPPVKSPSQKDRLWQMLVDGSIDFIASDHAPGTVAEKSTGSIWTDYAGIPGGPVIFPYTLSEGYLNGRMGLQRFLEVTSGAAARRYRIDDRKGSIEIGKDADLVFIDPEGSWTVDMDKSPSLGKVSPWNGRTLKGRIIRTIVRGTTVYDDTRGVVGSPGHGEFLAPNRATENR